ncbi:MAG TPA: hypothetical protein VJP89_24640 [Pyrinomonadaceae bacterium]|nr:hypothetical protein [Pyrinomonadaceae bacterium]
MVLFQQRIKAPNGFFKCNRTKLYAVQSNVVSPAQLDKYLEGLFQLSYPRAVAFSFFFKLLEMDSKLGLLLKDELHRASSFFVSHSMLPSVR